MTDIEDGPTLSQLLTLNVEVGRLSLAREKAQVNSTVVALTSILDAKVLSEFNKNIDHALAETDVLGVARGKKSGTRSSGGRSDGVSGKRNTRIVKTMNELQKLNALMGG